VPKEQVNNKYMFIYSHEIRQMQYTLYKKQIYTIQKAVKES